MEEIMSTARSSDDDSHGRRRSSRSTNRSYASSNTTRTTTDEESQTSSLNSSSSQGIARNPEIKANLLFSRTPSWADDAFDIKNSPEPFQDEVVFSRTAPFRTSGGFVPSPEDKRHMVDVSVDGRDLRKEGKLTMVDDIPFQRTVLKRRKWLVASSCGIILGLIGFVGALVTGIHLYKQSYSHSPSPPTRTVPAPPPHNTPTLAPVPPPAPATTSATATATTSNASSGTAASTSTSATQGNTAASTPATSTAVVNPSPATVVDNAPPLPVPTDKQCVFTGQVQPDVFLQCHCFQKVAILSGTGRVQYNQLRQQWFARLVPDFDEPTVSCSRTNQVLIWLALNAVEGDDPTDRFTLGYLYASLNGPQWFNSDRWMTKTSICQWFGVVCDGNGRLTGLTLQENNIEGELPVQQLSFLSSTLTVLNLGKNNLSGRALAPSSPLYQLVRLTNLELKHNQLSGPLSPDISKLTGLKKLALEENEFTGTLPSQLPTNLEMLTLFSNNIKGTIPVQLGNLKKLRHIKFQNNQMSGTIPTVLGQLTGLENLELSRNNFRGTVPSEVGLMTNLLGLEISHMSQVGGMIATQIGQLSNLRLLALEENQMEGTLPTELGLLSQLEFLILHSNQFRGGLPTEIGNLANMVEFHVHKNQLDGPVPSELGRCQALEMIQLGDNRFEGSVPTQVCVLRQINVRTLISNCNSAALTCPVPSCCTACTK